MTPTLHLLTPVSRPQFLPQIRRAIRERFTPAVRVEWWLIVDLNGCTADACRGFGDHLLTCAVKDCAGGSHRNAALERITGHTDWVAFVDDDNAPHPAFEGRLLAAIGEGHDGLVVSQSCGWDGRDIYADPATCRRGRLDTAMMAFSIAAIRGLRFRENVYESDWWFFAEARERCRSIKYDPTLAAFYNALRTPTRPAGAL